MKKCAVINDLSGFGKCSLTVALPILSVMGHEAHPLTTAVLSNQTAYDSFKSVAMTFAMKDFIAEWKKLCPRFDGILTGYFADEKQIDIINGFIDDFKDKNTVVLVDPIMADNGALYDGFTPAMCEKIRALCRKADIITPNIDELAFLADEKYSDNYDDLIKYGKKLNDGGIKNVVVTGYKEGDTISDIVFEDGKISRVTSKLIGGYFSGTGDITASVIMGGVLRGMSVNSSAELACDFINKSINATDSENHNDGIAFEKYLGDLI